MADPGRLNPSSIVWLHAPADAELVRGAVTACDTLRTRGLARQWACADTPAGADLDATVRERLAAADVIVLCVSVELLGRYLKWLDHALELERPGVWIVPLLLRPAALPPSLEGRACLPRGGGALVSRVDREQALVELCEELRAGIESRSGKRIALIIGNSEYVDAPILRAAVSDAQAMNGCMKRLGFETLLVTNGMMRPLNEAVGHFTGQVGQSDLAFFFYFGHGIAHNGSGRLIPVDAQIRSVSDIPGQTLDFSEVSRGLQSVAGAKRIVFFLDSCMRNITLQSTIPEPAPGPTSTHDDPFHWTPVTSHPLPETMPDEPFHWAALKGGAEMRGPNTPVDGVVDDDLRNAPLPVVLRNDVLFVFSAQRGRSAVDVLPGDLNSPFALALLDHLGERGMSLMSTLERVQRAVEARTALKQRPWWTGVLTRDLYLAGP